MKKKLTVVALVVVLVALLLTGMSMAYFTDTDTATNVFTVGDIDIELTEPDWGDGNEDTDDVIENIVPGVEYDKTPTITNEGSNSAYIRVKVTFPGYKNATTYNPKSFLVGLNTTDFKVTDSVVGDDYVIVMESYNPLAKDGVLKAFTDVKLPAEMKQADLLTAYGVEKLSEISFKIVVDVQAIQSEGFANATAAFAALDTPANP